MKCTLYIMYKNIGQTRIKRSHEPDLQDDARVYEHRQVRKKYVERDLCGGHPRFDMMGISRTLVLEETAR